VKLRSEPPTTTAAAVMDFGTTTISRAVGCSLMSPGSEAAAPMVVILAELLQIHMHHLFRCCVAMQLRVETRDRCLSCARRSRSSSVEEIVDEFDCQSAGDESEVKSLLVVDRPNVPIVQGAARRSSLINMAVAECPLLGQTGHDGMAGMP
jgi:hypothetical protein